MHARFEAPTVKFMASDGQPDTPNVDGNVSLCIHSDDDSEGARVFNKLAEGGKVEMPLQDAFWGAKFGVLKDKFGIEWFVDIGKP